MHDDKHRGLASPDPAAAQSAAQRKKKSDEPGDANGCEAVGDALHQGLLYLPQARAVAQAPGCLSSRALVSGPVARRAGRGVTVVIQQL